MLPSSIPAQYPVSEHSSGVARLRSSGARLLPQSYADPHLVGANVYFLDAAGQVVLLIEEMECIASAALNRLGGTAEKRAVALPA